MGAAVSQIMQEPAEATRVSEGNVLSHLCKVRDTKARG